MLSKPNQNNLIFTDVINLKESDTFCFFVEHKKVTQIQSFLSPFLFFNDEHSTETNQLNYENRTNQMARAGQYFVGSPKIWCKNLYSGLFYPFNCTSELFKKLKISRTDSNILCKLSSVQRAYLHFFNILVDKHKVEFSKSNSPPILNNFHETLNEKGYFILKKIIPHWMLPRFQLFYNSLNEAGYFEIDKSQVINKRHGVCNDAASLYIQNCLASILNTVLPKKIKPTYTWVMEYFPGAILRKHVDKPQCRWNVSLCIENKNGNNPWPLFIEHNKQINVIALHPGDAVFYSGTKSPHWRNELVDKNTTTFCLLHYVSKDYQGTLT